MILGLSPDIVVGPERILQGRHSLNVVVKVQQCLRYIGVGDSTIVGLPTMHKFWHILPPYWLFSLNFLLGLASK